MRSECLLYINIENRWRIRPVTNNVLKSSESTEHSSTKTKVTTKQSLLEEKRDISATNKPAQEGISRTSFEPNDPKLQVKTETIKASVFIGRKLEAKIRRKLLQLVPPRKKSGTESLAAILERLGDKKKLLEYYDGYNTNTKEGLFDWVKKLLVRKISAQSVITSTKPLNWTLWSCVESVLRVPQEPKKSRYQGLYQRGYQRVQTVVVRARAYLGQKGSESYRYCDYIYVPDMGIENRISLKGIARVEMGRSD